MEKPHRYNLDSRWVTSQNDIPFREKKKKNCAPIELLFDFPRARQARKKLGHLFEWTRESVALTDPVN